MTKSTQHVSLTLSRRFNRAVDRLPTCSQTDLSVKGQDERCKRQGRC